MKMLSFRTDGPAGGDKEKEDVIVPCQGLSLKWDTGRDGEKDRNAVNRQSGVHH